MGLIRPRSAHLMLRPVFKKASGLVPPTSNFRFLGFSWFSARFPGVSWSGRVWAARGTHFPAPESIFHARESNFHAQNRFFLLRNRFFPAEDGFSLVFDLFSWSGRVRAGLGTYFHAQESMFMLRNRFFMLRNRCFMPVQAQGTPGGLHLTYFTSP